jgi:hypothetical protein
MLAEHALALLDTSCVIDFPDQLEERAEAAAVSTLTIAELATAETRRLHRYREHRAAEGPVNHRPS